MLEVILFSRPFRDITTRKGAHHFGPNVWKKNCKTVILWSIGDLASWRHDISLAQVLINSSNNSFTGLDILTSTIITNLHGKCHERRFQGDVRAFAGGLAFLQWSLWGDDIWAEHWWVRRRWWCGVEGGESLHDVLAEEMVYTKAWRCQRTRLVWRTERRSIWLLWTEEGRLWQWRRSQGYRDKQKQDQWGLGTLSSN